MHTPSCVLISLLMIADGLIVRGPSGPLVAPLGSSVVLPCYVDEPLPVKGLEVQWRRTDSEETSVHLFLEGESRPEVQQQDYQDRAHFFTDQIQHGNFSLRLDNLTAEDQGNYTCKVYSQQDSGGTEVQIKDVERLLVSGSSRSISAYDGEDVTLNCSVDSHIKPEHIEEVSWRKTDEDEDIQVLLYQNNEAFPDSSDEQYRDRVEFFTDEIPKGNFSLRLKSVRTEDKGVYMCQAFAGRLSAKATVVLERLGFSALQIMVLILSIAASGSALLLCCLIYSRLQNGFTVTYSQDTLVRLGSSVVLRCYSVKPLPVEDLKVEWRRKDTKALVHLYQSRAEEQQQDYQDRAHLFTDQIQHGNFSLRLDNLRAEDEGKYTCTVYSKHRHELSTENNVEPRLLNSFLRLHLSLVFWPNMILFFAFVFWGVSEGSVNESVCCSALYFLRPLLLLWAAPYINKFTGKIQTWIQKYSYVAEYVVFSVVAYSALFKTAWQKLLNYAVLERVVIIVLFSIVFLSCLCKIIYLLVTQIGKKTGRIIEIFGLVADMIFDILPTLQFVILFYTFASSGAGFIIVVILPVFMMMTNDRWFIRCRVRLDCSRSVMRTVMIIFTLVMNAVMIGLYIMTLEKTTDPIGWGCVLVFLQILWTIVKFTDVTLIFLSIPRDFHRFVLLYVFGSVCVVLLASAALITELILKTVNGDRTVRDLRFIVFPAECFFAVSVLISGIFASQIRKCLKSCQDSVRSRRERRSTQNPNTEETLEMMNTGDQ